MRDYLLENFSVVEDTIRVGDLKEFDEAFISNSIMGVRPVKSINSLVFSSFQVLEKILNKLKKYGF